ncbi:MAG: putative molybdenum carrier protein [Planctomycetota bacterium]
MSAVFHGIERIVSGGQTGVDRAALDTAILLGIPHGGWCPKGRLAEDGPIPDRYLLTEMESADYAKRTRQNVIDSDGTLLLYRERLQSGTLLTHRIAKELGRPIFRIRLDRSWDPAKAVDWIQENQIQVLNVAGPRGSSHPDIATVAAEALQKILRYQSLPIEQ